MLLFTLDIRQWSKVAGTAMLSMLFATTSVVSLATVLFYLFRGEGVETSSHLAAMSVGLYTGGTPNLAAIKAALDIPHSQYIIFHSLDTSHWRRLPSADVDRGYPPVSLVSGQASGAG